MIVIDASVAVKWYFPEILSDEAINILDNTTGNLIAPDILAVEVNAALVRKGNMDKSQCDGVRIMLTDFEQKLAGGEIILHRSNAASLMKSAAHALTLGHPLKDCLYLTLAMEQDCALLTCDARFALKAKTIWSKVRLLGE